MRRYDPVLRRFLQPDPATRGGVPDYVYANDAPLDLGDPSGHAGTPSACGRQSYVDQGNNVTSCGWQALRARQEAGAQAALWAVPNLFVLDPLRNLTGANSSPLQRVLGGLALLPFAGEAIGVGARTLAFAARAARGTGPAAELVAAVSRVSSAASASTEIALDNNAIVGALHEGELAAVDAALAGRVPVLTLPVVTEYLTTPGRTMEELEAFLDARGGRFGGAAVQDDINMFLTEARRLGRYEDAQDAAVFSSALQEGLPILTKDRRFFRLLRAIGYPVETYAPYDTRF